MAEAEAKDKLVTLEDLKTAIDDLKEKTMKWEDITSTLAWTNVSYTTSTGIPTVPAGTSSQFNASGTYRKASLAMAKGDLYRISGPVLVLGQRDYAALRAPLLSDGTVNYCYNGLEFAPAASAAAKASGEMRFRCTKAGTYTVYDWSGSGSIIVEKAAGAEYD